MTRDPESRPDVQFEPQFRAGPFRADPSDVSPPHLPGAPVEADQSVWEEPDRAATSAPAGAVTYARWFDTERAAASPFRAWLLAIGLAVVAGPWAILGVFVGQFEGGTVMSLLAVVVFGPVIEEICKVSAVLILAERRPFRFTNRAQLLLGCLGSGLVFALIENQLYFHFYVDDPTPQLIAWRGSVCVALHAGCSLVAGLGIARMWRIAMRTRTRPRPEQAAPAFTVAAVIHGTYNALALLLDPVFR